MPSSEPKQTNRCEAIMKAAYYLAGRIEVGDVPDPVPGKGQVPSRRDPSDPSYSLTPRLTFE